MCEVEQERLDAEAINEAVERQNMRFVLRITGASLSRTMWTNYQEDGAFWVSNGVPAALVIHYLIEHGQVERIEKGFGGKLEADQVLAPVYYLFGGACWGHR